MLSAWAERAGFDPVGVEASDPERIDLHLALAIVRGRAGRRAVPDVAREIAVGLVLGAHRGYAGGFVPDPVRGESLGLLVLVVASRPFQDQRHRIERRYGGRSPIFRRRAEGE